MTVRGTPFSVTLPSLFPWLFGVGRPTPAEEGQEDVYEESPSKPPAGTTRPFPFASIFAPKVPPQKKPPIDERIKHIYQGNILEPKHRLCRFAVLEMISQYLQNELKISGGDVPEIIPREIYNGEIDAVISGWRRPNGFEGPVRNPDAEDLQRVLDTIDAHLNAGLPVPAYVSHTNGVHVVLVTDKITTTAYRFVDPATRDESRSRGTLVKTKKTTIKNRKGRTKEISVGNFVKPGNTDKRVRGTANQQYYLLGVYSYLDAYNTVVNQTAEVAIDASRPASQLQAGTASTTMPSSRNLLP